MKRNKTTSLFLISALGMLLLFTGALADQLQCPDDIDKAPVGDFPGPGDIDHNGNGILDDDPGSICMWIQGGDGFAKMGDDRTLYTFGFSEVPLSTIESQAQAIGIENAHSPAPNIFLKEGQELYLNLGNVGTVNRPDLNDPHTVHWHGFPEQSAIHDGVPEVSVGVKLGTIFTYWYRAVRPGTYFYHCHVEAPEHIQMGMIGNLYVRSAQDGTTFEHPAGSGRFYNKFAYDDGDGSTGYDVEAPLQASDFGYQFHTDHLNVQPLFFYLLKNDYPMFNGRGYPDTKVAGPIFNDHRSPPLTNQEVPTVIRAVVGQRILLRLSNVSVQSFHTVQVLGIPATVVGKDARLLRGPGGADLTYKANSVTFGGGESYDVILDTTDVAPGTYFIYGRSLSDLNNYLQAHGGLMAEIHISAH